MTAPDPRLAEIWRLYAEHFRNRTKPRFVYEPGSEAGPATITFLYRSGEYFVTATDGESQAELYARAQAKAIAIDQEMYR